MEIEVVDIGASTIARNIDLLSNTTITRPSTQDRREEGKPGQSGVNPKNETRKRDGGGKRGSGTCEKLVFTDFSTTHFL